MKLNVNYVSQLLLGRNHRGDAEKYTNLSNIRENYEGWIEKHTGPSAHKDEVFRAESLVYLKLAYLNVMASVKEVNSGQMPEPTQDFDKTPIKKLAEESSKKTKSQVAAELDSKAENPRRNNEYVDLYLPIRADERRVRERYLAILEQLIDELDRYIERGEYDFEKIQAIETMARTKEGAFEQLTDPEYKMMLDELLLFNFNPNQSDLYIPGNMAEVTYMPETKKECIIPGSKQTVYKHRGVSFGSVARGDDVETIVYHIGNIGIGRFRQPSGKITYRDSTLIKDYKVLKRYRDKALAKKRKKATQQPGAISQWDDVLDAEVFRVSGDLHENILANPNVDLNFVRYTNEVLLSITNIEQALINNGGYIGSVEVSRDGSEYVVSHNRDALCAATELQKVGTVVDTEGKSVLYQIDKRRITIAEPDIITGKFRPTINMSVDDVPAIASTKKMLGAKDVADGR